MNFVLVFSDCINNLSAVLVLTMKIHLYVVYISILLYLFYDEISNMKLINNCNTLQNVCYKKTIYLQNINYKKKMSATCMFKIMAIKYIYIKFPGMWSDFYL